MPEPWEKALADEGQTQLVTPEQAATIERTSQNVLTKDGKAYLMDPAGRPAAVPLDTAQVMLTKGYRPMDDREAIEYDSTSILPGAAESFIAHGANAALLGLPGLMSRLSPSDQGRTAETLRLTEELHPTASAAGSLAGVVGTGLIGGPMNLIARGAGTVGKAAAARAFGATAKGALPRALEWGVAGSIEGAAIGGVSAAEGAATHPEMKINDALASIISGAAYGGVGGAGLSLLGSGVGAVAGKLKAGQLAKREASLQEALNKGTAESVSKLDKAKADLAQHWELAPAVPGRAQGWLPPEKLQIVAALERKLSELSEMPASTFRQRLATADSWEAKAADLLKRQGQTERGAAREAQRLERAAEEAAEKGYAAAPPRLREQAKGVRAAARAESDALSPTISYLEKQARLTAKQVQSEHKRLIRNIRGEIQRLRSEVDSVPTASGHKVSQLDDKVRELQMDLDTKRQAIIDKFDASYTVGGVGGPATLVGRWMAHRAASAAMGGPAGYAVTALVGKQLAKVTESVSKAVRGVTGSRVGQVAGRVAKQSAKVGAIQAATDIGRQLEAVLAASPEQLEKQARYSAEMAGITFGVPQALQDQAVTRNTAALQFLQDKAKALK